MDFKEFCQKIYSEVTAYYGEKITAEIKEIVKNNGVTLTALLLSEKDGNVAPAIYLDSYYNDYENGAETEDLTICIINLYEKVRKNPRIDLDFFVDYNKVKERICFKLINYSRNQKLLKDIPHIRYMNLAIVFYYAYSGEVLGSGAILIRNSHKEGWRISTEELLNQARSNTERLFPAKIMRIEEVIKEIAGRNILDEDYSTDISMYVVTNSIKNNGAICMMYPGVLQRIAMKEMADLFVLPSSVHEVIILPDHGQEVETLREMVKEVNETQVAEDEVLADAVYYYDRSTEAVTLLG